MSVAPSFQSFEMLTEPYAVGDKMYIKVRNPKTGTERQVRWYEEKKKVSHSTPVLNAQDVYYKPQKEVLGFTKGYITIFKGDTYKYLDWFRASIARYARYWGWYIISTDEIPNDIPEELEPIQLAWELVGNENGFLNSESDVQKAVESIMYEAGESEYVGNIGERLELDVIVTRVIELDGAYGVSNMHIMEDPCGNVYVWTTASKSWAEGSHKIIRGTVKDHRTYKNVKQTVLNRCMEVKN